MGPAWVEEKATRFLSCWSAAPALFGLHNQPAPSFRLTLLSLILLSSWSSTPTWIFPSGLGLQSSIDVLKWRPTPYARPDSQAPPYNKGWTHVLSMLSPARFRRSMIPR
jgi:hypothetical protein